MNIIEFKKLSLDDIKKYDFTHDVCDMYIQKNNKMKKNNANDKFNDYKNTKGIEKYIIYRQFKSKYKKSLDPDLNSDLLQKIYIELWDNKYIEKNCLKKNNIYYSDTLTSAQTRLNDNIKVSKKELNLDIKNVSSKVIMKKYNSDEHFKNCLDSSEQFDEVREMIEKYHTLGNYCPVPKGFNNARSGFGVYDSINLMLEKIKEFYDGYNKNEILGNDNINAILELLRFKSTYKNTLEWLKGFGDWKTFVDNNFFSRLC